MFHKKYNFSENNLNKRLNFKNKKQLTCSIIVFTPPVHFQFSSKIFLYITSVCGSIEINLNVYFFAIITI